MSEEEVKPEVTKETEKVFKKNLDQEAASQLWKLQQDLGVAISDVVKRYRFSGRITMTWEPRRVDEYHKQYVELPKDTSDNLREFLATKAMEDFKQSLENFAWAIKQGGQ